MPCAGATYECAMFAGGAKQTRPHESVTSVADPARAFDASSGPRRAAPCKPSCFADVADRPDPPFLQVANLVASHFGKIVPKEDLE